MNDLEDGFTEELEDETFDNIPMSRLRAKGIALAIRTGGDNPERDALLEIGAVAFTLYRSRFQTVKPVEIDAFHMRLFPNPRLSVSPIRLREAGRSLSNIGNPELPSEVLAYQQFRRWLFRLGKWRQRYSWTTNFWAHDALLTAQFLTAWEKRVYSDFYEQKRIFPRPCTWCCTKAFTMIVHGMGLLRPEPKVPPASDPLNPYEDYLEGYGKPFQRSNALENARNTVDDIDGFWNAVGWF